MNIAVRRLLTSSVTLWVLITIVGIYFVSGLDKHINYGIDLVGGTYIRLDVEVEHAVETALADRVRYLMNKLPEAQLGNFKIERGVAQLSFATEEQARQAESALYNAMAGNERFAGLEMKRVGMELNFSLAPKIVERIQAEAVRGNIEVLSSRLNAFGVSETLIAAQGDRGIIIELPNVDDPQKAKAMIGKTALLEIKLVHDIAGSESELLDRYGGNLPDGFVIVPEKEDEFGRVGRYYLLQAYADVTGRLLDKASLSLDQRNRPVVAFSFKPEGADKFYELTSKNIGQPIAMVLDGKVLTAPTVQSAISSQGTITGNFTSESARDLARLLQSGAFVAPVSFGHEQLIEASLGSKSIHQGLIACLVGLGLLLFFALLFYKVAGLLACIVLVYNLLLILFALSWLGATLTLPGIAGMLLTIGMAIDASILIYERIKEELAKGVPFRQALETGFAGAMSVILDANITHFLVAVVLYKLGAGPIKGFAVTMIVGILSTLITGLFLLKTLFTFVLDVLGCKRVSI
jgi:preprotein translocase subunit SecD